MASIFSKIIAGDIPCYFIAENDSAFAFLDINPLQEGHVLVVPKKEVNHYFDLEDADFIEVNKLAKRIANAMRKSFNCLRIGEAVIGLEVPHAHLHLVPINKMSDIDFTQPKLNPSKERMQELAELIKSNL